MRKARLVRSRILKSLTITISIWQSPLSPRELQLINLSQCLHTIYKTPHTACGKRKRSNRNSHNLLHNSDLELVFKLVIVHQNCLAHFKDNLNEINQDLKSVLQGRQWWTRSKALLRINKLLIVYNLGHPFVSKPDLCFRVQRKHLYRTHATKQCIKAYIEHSGMDLLTQTNHIGRKIQLTIQFRELSRPERRHMASMRKHLCQKQRWKSIIRIQ